jgi:hypothetical protein
MRMLIVVVVAVVVVAFGFMMKPAVTPGSSADPAAISRAIEASTTIWPHEIHINYRAMKELPVHDIKEPF